MFVFTAFEIKSLLSDIAHQEFYIEIVCRIEIYKLYNIIRKNIKYDIEICYFRF